MAPEAWVTAFAPATAGNVICGFDVFGLALESPGDRVSVRRSERSGLSISAIVGDGGRLPTDPSRNAATVAIAELLRTAGSTGAVTEGIEVRLDKGLPLSGGMGGSAASSVAAVVAVDALLGTALDRSELLRCALAGEALASGAAHLDNAAPALYGGLVLVRPGRDREVTPLPVPPELSVALLHPSVEMNTRDGRAALGTTVQLPDAVAQWGHTAAFVHALHTGDWDLLADALEDRIAEPHRSKAIPGFAAVRRAALGAGAVGCGISGSGPSILAICRGLDRANAVGTAMLDAFRVAAAPEATLHVSRVPTAGAAVEDAAL